MQALAEPGTVVVTAQVQRQIAGLFVAEESGRSLGITFDQSDDSEYLVDNPSRRAPNLAKIIAATGWRPAVPLREGIARTLAYYRAEEAR